MHQPVGQTATRRAEGSLFRPRSSSPPDVKPNVQALRQAQAPSAPAEPARPSSTSQRFVVGSSAQHDGPLTQGSIRTERTHPRNASYINSGTQGAGSPATPRPQTGITSSNGASTVAAPQLQHHREVFPLPLECRSVGDEPVPTRVKNKRPLFVQSLYEDLEIQHGKPIVSVSSEFHDEDIELIYYFEPLREGELCVRLPVSLRRSNAHFAGSVTQARESFKLEQVTGFAVQGKMAKETRFTYAHLVIRFGKSGRTVSSSSSSAPIRSSAPPSAQIDRMYRTQEIFKEPEAPVPRVKMEQGSPASSVRGPTSKSGADSVPSHPATPPVPQPPGFPFNAKECYSDVQLTRNNVDAFLQMSASPHGKANGKLIIVL